MGQTRGGSSGNLELLKKIEILEAKLRESETAYIDPNEYFDFVENVEVIEIKVVKADKIIFLYAQIKILGDLEGGKICNIKKPYRPFLNGYFGSIRLATQPFLETCSIWFNRDGTVRIYGSEMQSQYYISASWPI